jgi:tripartite ATP-independent transporter DctM subunit
MLKRGYDSKIIYGSIAGGGSLGILIPPSIAMIVYGAVCQVSVGQLFMAGVIPGILLALLFMAFIAIKAILQPKLMPSITEKIGWKEKASAIVLTAPSLLLILVILGGIYAGVTTPSEAGAIGAVFSLGLALAYRKLSFKILREALLNALQTTCMIMLIVIGALTLSFAVANAGIPRAMIEWVSSIQVSKTLIMFFIYFLYIGLGCFFEGLSLLLMTIPITFPIVMGLGYDPIWFGVMIVIMLEMAMLTPPVGLILYVLHGLSGGRNLNEIVIGIMPFFAIECFAVILFTVFPQIVLFLPAQMAR